MIDWEHRRSVIRTARTIADKLERTLQQSSVLKDHAEELTLDSLFKSQWASLVSLTTSTVETK